MKSRNLVVCAIAVATLGIGSTSFAQGPMQRVIRAEVNAIQHVDDRRGVRNDRRNDRRDYRADRRDHRADQRNHLPAYRPAPTVHHHYHYNARSPDFKRGRYIPREYRNRQYVVVNPYHHRLAAPPRGHHWVQVGSDYVLIAIATGLIANIILN